MSLRSVLWSLAMCGACAALRGQEGTIQWRFTVANQGGISFSAPALSPDGSTVYVGSYDGGVGRVVAVPREGGTQPRWTFVKTGFVDSSPAVAPNGTVYVGHGNGYLYALNPADGKSIWERNLGGYVTSSPAIGPDGTIYVGAADHQLHALSPIDGAERWAFPTGGIIESSPAVAPDGTIYFGSYDRNIYAITSGGQEKWHLATGGTVFGSPAIGADGTVYVGSYDQRLYAIRADGTKRWEYLTNGPVQASPVIGADGTIYFAADTSFYALRPGDTDDRLRWKTAITPQAGSVSTAAVRGDGVVIFGDDNGIVHALNPENGSEKWHRDTDTHDYIESSPIVAPDGSIYVGSFPYLIKIVGNGSPLSTYSPWPAFHRDPRHTAQAFVTNGGSGRLVNISSRALAGGGRNLIAGFVVRASNKAYLLRAVGPGLAALQNVSGFMPDPRLDVYSGSVLFRSNDNWVETDDITGFSIPETTKAVEAFALAPGSADAVILPGIQSGSLTASVTSADGRPGVALVEIYDVPNPSDPTARLLNLSTRGFVGTGENVLIAGFVVRDGPMRLLLRGIGQGLTQFGVPSVLSQPKITVFSGATPIASNTGWTTDGYRNDILVAGSLVSAFPLADTQADSALVFEVKQPGPYTIQISGGGNLTGEAMVEIWALP